MLPACSVRPSLIHNTLATQHTSQKARVGTAVVLQSLLTGGRPREVRRRVAIELVKQAR